jgi:hypothetical protein
MGLLLSKEIARLEELRVLTAEAWALFHALGPAAAAEYAAGIPAVPGTSQALRWAAAQRALLLQHEQAAILRRICEFCPMLLLTWE